MLSLLGEAANLELWGGAMTGAAILGGVLTKLAPVALNLFRGPASVAAQTAAATQPGPPLPVNVICPAHAQLDMRLTKLETQRDIEMPHVQEAVKELAADTKAGFQAIHKRLDRLYGPGTNEEENGD
ncbi:MAG: hypothetical protein PHU85_00340 [Phycisphaerae bacterium]|nr:hypothetical protein [Phycisphaerae bacterium]